jgi:4-amino-4-deoxy-L-arabinose transferase-like glycosyltransferase
VSGRTKCTLLAILLLGGALRFVELGTLPPALHPDEAANALEALSLRESGRSTDGRFLPVVFEHHGVDYVEGTYIWLAVPFVSDADASIRIPAALAGTFAILATFFLGARLGGTRLGLLAALLLAIEPWAVHHSRFGDRPTLEPLLLAAGLALGLRGFDTRSQGLSALGGLLLGGALVNYPPARIVVPLVALAFALSVAQDRREGACFLVPIVLAGIAILPFAFSERGLHRLHDIGVTSPGAVLYAYGLHFVPKTLFLGAEGQGFLPKGVGPLHFFEAPLVLLALVPAARVKRCRFLLAWLVVFPLASAFTQPAPNLIRAIFGLPLFALLGALGIETLLQRAAPRKVAIVLAPLMVACLVNAVLRYVLVFPTTTSAWEPYVGERETVSRMHGRVKLTKANERALVELYGRGRPHWWIAPDEVVFED